MLILIAAALAAIAPGLLIWASDARARRSG